MNKVYFVTRHPGAIRWFEKTNTRFEDVVMAEHFSASVVESGDIVIGILPVSIAADVVSRGGRFIALTINTPAHLRGVELTEDQLDEIGCSLREFKVENLGSFEL